MSSNSTARLTRTLLALCLAASAAGCATGEMKKAAKDAPGLTPTEQFAITVTPGADEILLAPHAEGLSQAQGDALTALVGRWRDIEGGAISIKTPAAGGDEAYHSVAAIQTALEQMGVRPDQIRVTSYQANPDAPIAVGYARYEAKGPVCGKDWKSYTNDRDNGVTSNFGCANTSNIAAMIANPADLLAPRESTPSDAARREVVLGKYRAGEITSAAKDSQADGSVSAAAAQ